MKWLIAMAVTVVCAGLIAPVHAGQNAGGDKAAVTVAGKWHFVLDTEGGDRNIDANFQQDGKNVTGKFGKDDAKGTFEDGKLTMEFAMNSDEVGPGTMKIKGGLGKDTLTGDWAFQTYSGTYKATRVP